MSYILDALKRADSERRRGSVPSIFAQQATYLPAEPQPRGNIRAVLWLIAGLLTVIAAGLAWKLGGNDRADNRAALALNNAATPVSAPAPVPTPTPTPVAAGPVSPAATAAASDAPDARDDAKASAAPAQARTATPASGISPASSPNDFTSSRTAAPPAKRPAQTESIPPVTAAAKRSADVDPPASPVKPVKRPDPRKEDDTTTLTSTQRVYAVSELPPDIQQQLPKLAISGGAYSTDPASRLLIVNDQVYTEKSQPVPGLLVEQIRRNAVVLSYKGYLYRLAY